MTKAMKLNAMAWGESNRGGDAPVSGSSVQQEELLKDSREVRLQRNQERVVSWKQRTPKEQRWPLGSQWEGGSKIGGRLQSLVTSVVNSELRWK